jgi:putative ATP-binding cassette transporter
MKLFSILIKHSRNMSIGAILLGIISGILCALFIVYLNKSVTVELGLVNKNVKILMILALVIAGINMTSQLILNRIGQSSVYKLRMYLTKMILGLPLKRLEQIGSNKIIVVLTEDVANIANAINMLPSLLIYSITLIACLVYLCKLSLTLFLIWIAVAIVVSVLFQLLQIRAFNAFERGRDVSDDIYKYFEAITFNAKEFKTNWTKRNEIYNLFLKNKLNDYQQYYLKGNNYYSYARSIGEGVYFLSLSTILLLPALLNIHQTSSLLTLFMYMQTPLVIVMNALPIFARSLTSVKKVEQLGINLTETNVNTDISIVDTIDKRPDPSIHQSFSMLEIRDIEFSYNKSSDDTYFKVGPINMTFTPGSVTFLVGGNGSGKTTLAKIIAGLYKQENGHIVLDGGIIDDINRDKYRQLYSAVWFDFYLFEKIIGQGDTKSKSQIDDYLKRLNLDKKVTIENDTFSTLNLSQGQRKRLALLSALIEDRPFYIFDEWAADQDPNFKDIFYKEIIPELKRRKKTVLAISHDSQYFNCADRVVYLDYGHLSDVKKK